MDKSTEFVITECIYCGLWFMICKGDYPFCDSCIIIVEKGLDTSTIPDERFNRVQELLAQDWVSNG